MKTYSKKYLPLIIGTACAVGIMMGSFFNFSDSGKELFAANANKKKLERLIDYINYDYVEEVNTDSIVDVTITSILKDLDPHSTYIPKGDFEAVSENMEGGFVGIGVQFFIIRDTVAVSKTIEGGPSEKAGIKSGDRLLYADNIPLFGEYITGDSLKDILRGDINSTVSLKIKREGHDELMDIDVNRENIPIKSVDASYMLNPKLGYVKMNRFSETTYTEFKKALSTLEEQGATEIALDLRNNPGGYLDEAIKVADEFLKKDKLILVTKDRNGKTKEKYATARGDFKDAKVYVLIDQNSASASEVVAGALQDNDVGTIVGRRSYGKGLVQREMGLGDGSAVRLTVARYYTPTGRSIQKPYENGHSKAYFSEYLKRYENGELVNKDSIHVNDSLKYTTPKGKVVYGGGGIIPDVFVPKDISYKKESLNYMLRGGIMARFVFQVIDENRSYYGNLSLNDFEDQVKITDDLVEEFIVFLQKFNVRYEVGEYEGLLKEYLKASMARQLFGINPYEREINREDPMIQKILELDSKDNGMS